MRRLLLATLALGASYGIAFADALTPADWHYAQTVYTDGYVDHSYMVELSDGTIVMTLTHSAQPEGGDQQHVSIIRSTDNGNTWSAPIDIEPASNPESSWGAPYYHAPTNTLYVFYVYNFEDVRFIPDNDGVGGGSRVDTIGKIAWKASTDGGLTWGPRNLITLPSKAIDLRNPFSGQKHLLWLYGQPYEHNGKIYLGFTKMGNVNNGSGFNDTESFILRMDMPAANPVNIPTTMDGIKAPTPFWCCAGTATKNTEEPSPLVFDDGLISVIARNERGRLTEAWSTNWGGAFTVDWARLSKNCDDTVYHPRGPAYQWKLPSGKFLLWTYNNNDPGMADRNPVWYRIGERVGDRIQWGDAYALVFYQALATRIGYPSMLIDGAEMLIAASDKTKIKLLRFPIPN